jgi:hypothetical protein
MNDKIKSSLNELKHRAETQEVGSGDPYLSLLLRK